MTGKPPLTLYRKKSHLVAMAASCLGLTYIAVMMLRHHPETRSTWLGVLAMSAIPSCGMCLAYTLFRLCVPTPAVVVDDEGLLDNASITGAGMLRWEEISDVFAYEFKGQRMLGIVPVDGVAFERLPRLKRLVLGINKHIGVPPFNIPLKILPVSADELLASIEERQRGARGRPMA